MGREGGWMKRMEGGMDGMREGRNCPALALMRKRNKKN